MSAALLQSAMAVAQEFNNFDQLAARIVGDTSERLVDDDGDGSFEAIEVTIEVEGELMTLPLSNLRGVITKNGKSLMTSVLDWQQQGVGSSVSPWFCHGDGAPMELHAGERKKLTYRFPTSWLRMQRVDGPYELLFSVELNSSIAPEIFVGQVKTKEYRYADFPEAQLQLTFIESGPFDVEEDGRPDILLARIKAAAVRGGKYTVFARLSNGHNKHSVGLSPVVLGGGEDLLLSLEPGVVQDVNLYFAEPFSGFRADGTVSFSHLDVLAIESKSGLVVSLNSPVKLSHLLLAGLQRLFAGPREPKIDMVLHGIDADGNGLFEQWGVDISVSPLPLKRYRIHFNLMSKSTALFQSIKFECEPVDGVCSRFIPISLGHVVVEQLDLLTTIDVSGRLYYSDWQNLARLQRLQFLSIKSALKNEDDGIFLGQIESVTSLPVPADLRLNTEPADLVVLQRPLQYRRLASSPAGDVSANSVAVAPSGKLQIVGKVFVRYAGTYVFNGLLLDAKHDFLGPFGTRLILKSGWHEITLDVDADRLKGSSGPFLFVDCAFYLDQGKDTPPELFARNRCQNQLLVPTISSNY